MSVIVIGLSHKSTPLEVLESLALTPARRADLVARLSACDDLHEVMVLATCNRVEVYAETATFHGAVSAISDALAAVSGLPLAHLRDHVYVHFADRAVSHLFSVAAGLDSMAIGESQILGQLREALRSAREGGHIGSGLDGLVQQSLRVGKRAHSETDIDGVSRSLVERGISRCESQVGALTQQRVLVVGAGAMSSLAAHTVSRLGGRSLTIINRTAATAERLAESIGARALPWEQLASALVQADLVISCTGAVGHVITADLVGAGPDRQAFLDLALPRDVAPEVADRAGAVVISLADLGGSLGDERDQVEAVRTLVAQEVQDYLVGRRAAAVAPTVALLRIRAADVVTQELERLSQRAPGLSAADAAQVQLTVHRVVEKLLHTPTVRIKQLAGEGQDYTAAMRELFDLDPRHAQVLSNPEAQPGTTVEQEGTR